MKTRIQLAVLAIVALCCSSALAQPFGMFSGQYEPQIIRPQRITCEIGPPRSKLGLGTPQSSTGTSEVPTSFYSSGRFQQTSYSNQAAQGLPVGTWQASDRILIIAPNNRFRVYWMNNGKAQIDNGTYSMRGQRIDFRADSGAVWPWMLESQSQQSLVISHVEVGRRAFRPMPNQQPHDMVGRYKARYGTDRGVKGRADVLLYADGTYIFYEYAPGGQLDHIDMGIWTATDNTFTFHLFDRGRFETVPAQMQKTSDGFQMAFKALSGAQYGYACQRSN